MTTTQIPLDLGHRAAFARADFWVTESNRAAVSFIDAYPAWPAPLLLIYGVEGCGKTHLCHVFRDETDAVFYDPAVDVIAGDIRFPQIIDGIDRLIGDRAAEEKILHLYNLAAENDGRILATAATAQKDWPFALADLKSRLLAAPTVAMGAPDDTLMRIVLTKLFSDRQLHVEQGVIDYTVTRVRRSFAALRLVADAADRRALAEKRAVTVPLVREILSTLPDVT